MRSCRLRVATSASFVVRRSSFVVRRSSFLCRSSFVVRRSSFVVRRSSFVVRHSFVVRRSPFVVHCRRCSLLLSNLLSLLFAVRCPLFAARRRCRRGSMTVAVVAIVVTAISVIVICAVIAMAIVIVLLSPYSLSPSSPPSPHLNCLRGYFRHRRFPLPCKIVAVTIAATFEEAEYMPARRASHEHGVFTVAK